MRVALTVAATLAASLAGAGAGRAEIKARLNDAEIREALDWGRLARPDQLKQYVVKVAPTWTLNFDTPFLRVAQFSSQWKKLGRSISERDVPPGVSQGGLHVYALAVLQPTATEAQPKSISHVTIRRPGAIEVVQPVSLETNINRARLRDDFRPAGLAQSVHAVFQPRDFVAGHVIRIEFRDGGTESVPLTTDVLAGVR
jgi:hypothetical protein